jgi:hypothetical protein
LHGFERNVEAVCHFEVAQPFPGEAADFPCWHQERGGELVRVDGGLADLSLRPRLDDGPGAVVVADGFSCATQVDHLGARAVHLAELLDPGENA